MTRAELEEAVLYFRDAHVEAVHCAVAESRRMRLMAQALKPEQIWRLDCWIEDHMNNIFQRESREGKDGASPMWPDWQDYGNYQPSRNKKIRRVK
jgi:hypothetical protein